MVSDSGRRDIGATDCACDDATDYRHVTSRRVSDRQSVHRDTARHAQVRGHRAPADSHAAAPPVSVRVVEKEQASMEFCRLRPEEPIAGVGFLRKGSLLLASLPPTVGFGGAL